MAGSRQHDGASGWAGEGMQWTRDLSDNWSQAMGAWMALAKGAPGVEDAMSRMADPVQSFAQLLQSMSPAADGEGFSAAEITRRWRELLTQGDGDGVLQMLGKAGTGWNPETLLAPLLDAMQREAASALNQPAFGFAREHQARWQGLLKAQLEHQKAMSRYNALLRQSSEQAFALFESKLAEHEAQGRQLTSVRAIFDLWIDAAEEAYAQTAMTPEFREVYGDMVNTQMRLRAASQGELEQLCRALGLPTRSEVTATHRKLHALERELRTLRAQVAAPRPHPVPTPAPATAKAAARPAQKAAGKRVAAKAGAAKAGATNAPRKPSAAVRRAKPAAATPRPAAAGSRSGSRVVAKSARKPQTAARRRKES